MKNIIETGFYAVTIISIIIAMVYYSLKTPMNLIVKLMGLENEDKGFKHISGLYILLIIAIPTGVAMFMELIWAFEKNNDFGVVISLIRFATFLITFVIWYFSEKWFDELKSEYLYSSKSSESFELGKIKKFIINSKFYFGIYIFISLLIVCTFVYTLNQHIDIVAKFINEVESLNFEIIITTFSIFIGPVVVFYYLCLTCGYLMACRKMINLGKYIVSWNKLQLTDELSFIAFFIGENENGYFIKPYKICKTVYENNAKSFKNVAIVKSSVIFINKNDINYMIPVYESKK